MSHHGQHKKNGLQLTITQDKLVDLLMHSATREDIARLDAKNDKMCFALHEDIVRLDEKIDHKCSALHEDIVRLDEKVDAKIDKIFYGVVLAILVPIVVPLCSHFWK